ncbi:MAG: Fpg/Nei family DNA glycosylase [Fimbriimonas sp.]
MPELPEVESVCRTMRRVMKGKRIVRAEVLPDDIMLSGVSPDLIRAALEGRTVVDVNRKGKFWWIELDDKPWLFGHLGMSGWIRELDTEGMRLHSHGDAPMEDADGRPRFLKLLIEVEGGGKIAFTDGRRLGRLWLAPSPEEDKQVARLGFDAHRELPEVEDLHARIIRRKVPIKALLLDQGMFAGIGNYLADEVLYQARISPKRLANSLTPEETAALRQAIRDVLNHAVGVDADYKQFPDSWLFHHRWGGNRGASHVDGREIVRETVGGRTTAWVPEIQR